MTHTIAVLEYRNDVIHAIYRVVVEIAPNDERQGWPDTQRVARRCSRGAYKLQLQATW